MEMSQLEAIWADSSTQWNFDFNHRNEIQSNINDALNAQAALMLEMQEKQYKEMLAEAEASVTHMSEVVDKYQGQVLPEDCFVIRGTEKEAMPNYPSLVSRTVNQAVKLILCALNQLKCCRWPKKCLSI